MYRYGEFRENNIESHIRDMRDLKAMILLGIDLRHWLYGKDFEPTHFRQWCELLMLYRANMATKSTQQEVVEPGRLAATAAEEGHEPYYGEEVGDEDEEEFDDGDDEYLDEGYDYEHVARLNDSRQARGARPALRQTGPPKPSADSLAQVPFGGQCKGRHRGMCPIPAAQKDPSYDRRTAERNGTRCTHKDPV